MHRVQYHYPESNGELFRRYTLTVLILALSILLAFCPLASVGCACSGTSGPSSYNYLMGPEFDVNMDSFEEFAYENWEDPLPNRKDLTASPTKYYVSYGYL